jgi:hypothetical protein
MELLKYFLRGESARQNLAGSIVIPRLVRMTLADCAGDECSDGLKRNNSNNNGVGAPETGF